MGFFSKEEVPPAPDMSGVINAAKEIGAQSQTYAKDTLDWAKQQFAQNQQDIAGFIDNITSDSQTARDMIQQFQDVADTQLGLSRGALDIKDAALANAAKASGVADTQADVQQKQLGIEDKQLQTQDAFRQDQIEQQAHANALYQQYAQVYEPAQARFMADAEAQGTQQRIDQARAGAQAGVADQFQGARDAATRQLEAWGVKPSDSRFAALDLGTRIKEAATRAAAGEAAARAQEDRAFALRNTAIQQGAQIPGQAIAATNAATGIGSNVNAAGNVGAAYGSLANTAGSNVVGATNAATGATNAATGAQQAAISGAQGATQAQSGALAANTAAMGGEQAAGNLTNQTFQTGSQAIGTAPQYLSAAITATANEGNIQSDAYKNQLAEFKAEQTNTTGLGNLLGTAAGVATSMFAPEIKTGIKTAFSAEGGAIPAVASPTNGRAVDDVPAQLTAGEFVMPRDVTSWYGEKFFQQLIQKAQNEKNKAQAKPAIGPSTGQPPAVVSRPGPAIPMGAR